MDVKPADTVDVVIRSDLIGDESWQASLVRTEGAIDESARQLHVIAQINDPFGRNNVGRSPIKIGQYVTAEIEGKYLSEVLVIPNNTIYQGTYIYTVEDGILRRKDIDIAWQNDAEAVVASGLKPGDELVTTSLGQVTSGIRVSVIGAGGEGGLGLLDLPHRPVGAGPQFAGLFQVRAAPLEVVQPGLRQTRQRQQ